MELMWTVIISVSAFKSKLQEVRPKIMSCVMRKPTFCIWENKDADQLRGNRIADQGLCFRYIDSTIPLLPIYKIYTIFKPTAILCGCTAWFVWGLIGNPEDRISHKEAQIINEIPVDSEDYS